MRTISLRYVASAIFGCVAIPLIAFLTVIHAESAEPHYPTYMRASDWAALSILIFLLSSMAVEAILMELRAIRSALETRKI